VYRIENAQLDNIGIYSGNTPVNHQLFLYCQPKIKISFKCVDICFKNSLYSSTISSYLLKKSLGIRFLIHFFIDPYKFLSKTY